MYKYNIDVTPYGLNITENRKIKFINKTRTIKHEIKFEELFKVLREEFIGRFNSLVFIKKNRTYEFFSIIDVEDLEGIYKKMLKYRNIYNFKMNIRDLESPKYEYDVN